jgi:hypothetical protein
MDLKKNLIFTLIELLASLFLPAMEQTINFSYLKGQKV